MHRPHEIAQIESVLRRTFIARALGPYFAFQSPVTRDGQLDHLDQVDGLKQVDAVMTVVEQHCLDWHAWGYTVFLGYPNDSEGHHIFAVPNAHPMTLMNIFEVGAYNDVYGDTPERVKQFMAVLFETDPFVPYMVDAANFKIRFINPVSPARAADIAQAVADFDPDAYEFANASEDEDPIDRLQRHIVATRKLELWWD